MMQSPHIKCELSILNDSGVVLQVISMEWGNFKSPHFPLTPFDASLHAESSNPGSGVSLLKYSQLFIGHHNIYIVNV